jgi:hypothetical protein
VLSMYVKNKKKQRGSLKKNMNICNDPSRK